MRTIAEYLPEHPFFAGLPPEAMALIVGCARNRHFRTDEALFHTGHPADTFYVIRHGRVALEVHDPSRGSLVLATPADGEVLGWSWLVPPYCWFFDARAIGEVSAVAIDGACLRSKCDADPALGYALMQRIAHVMYVRLQDARMRLLDVYGGPV